jgi:hypothetical protein
MAGWSVVSFSRRLAIHIHIHSLAHIHTQPAPAPTAARKSFLSSFPFLSPEYPSLSAPQVHNTQHCQSEVRDSASNGCQATTVTILGLAFITQFLQGCHRATSVASLAMMPSIPLINKRFPVALASAPRTCPAVLSYKQKQYNTSSPPYQLSSHLQHLNHPQ